MQIPVIEATEDREVFSEKLKEIDETIALSYSATNVEVAKEAANKIGFPVLIRAAFALGAFALGALVVIITFETEANGALVIIFIVLINLRPLKIVHKIECHGDGVKARG